MILRMFPGLGSRKVHAKQAKYGKRIQNMTLDKPRSWTSKIRDITSALSYTPSLTATTISATSMSSAQQVPRMEQIFRSPVERRARMRLSCDGTCTHE